LGGGGERPAAAEFFCRTNDTGVAAATSNPVRGLSPVGPLCWSGSGGTGRWLIGRTVVLLHCWCARSAAEARGVDSDVADSKFGVEPLDDILAPGHVGCSKHRHHEQHFLEPRPTQPPTLSDMENEYQQEVSEGLLLRSKAAAQFTKYRTKILQLSYNNAIAMIHL